MSTPTGRKYYKKSPLWTIFTKYSDTLAHCSLCDKLLSYKNGTTSNLKRHMKGRHKTALDALFEENNTEPIVEYVEMGSVNNGNETECETLEVPESETETNARNDSETQQSRLLKYMISEKKRYENMKPFLKKKSPTKSTPYFQQQSNPTVKEWDLFDSIAANVAMKLKRMNPHQQLLTEFLITRVLQKGLFNELTRTTDIIDAAKERRVDYARNTTEKPVHSLHESTEATQDCEIIQTPDSPKVCSVVVVESDIEEFIASTNEKT